MAAISQVLLTRVWWNFNGSFLRTFRTDSIYQVDSCPLNICSGVICTYQEYLSCYWLNFDQTLKVSSWDHLWQMPTVKVTFVQVKYILATFVHDSKPKFDQTLKVGSTIFFTFLELKFFGSIFLPKFFWIQYFLASIFLDIDFLDQKIFFPNFFLQNNNHNHNFNGFWHNWN